VAACAGESWAREALFRRYAPTGLGLAYRLLGRDSEIEDIVQDCFVQALSSLHGLDDPQAFSAWFSAIVVRTVHKVLRRRSIATRLGLRRAEPAIDIDALVAPSAPPDVAAELGAVYRLVEALPPRVRIALVLRRVEGQSLDEVARHMGVALSTAKRLLAKAEEQLSRAL
jgi:RNA polymerase sigma-70 factor (ECF subfamily)